MEKNNKLLAVRDAILLCFSNRELSAEECREVLEMCKKEVDTAEKRANFNLIDEED